MMKLLHISLPLTLMQLFTLSTSQVARYPEARQFGDISDRTSFDVIELPKSPAGLQSTAIPFNYPLGCSPTTKVTADPFCVNGTYSSGETLDVDLDLNLFDVEIPSKRLVLGMFVSTTSDGKPVAMITRTGGCATILKQTIVIFLVDGVITTCTSGGGKGRYDPSLPGYVSDINLSGQLKFTSGIKTLMDYNYSLPGLAHAGRNFDMGMIASVHNDSGKPQSYWMNATVVVTLNTTENSLFDWRFFVGLTTNSSLYPWPSVHNEFFIVDSVVHLNV